MRENGNSKPEFCSAVRTRSRASRMAVSPRPTMVKAGSPRRMSTSTVTGRTSRPWIEKVVTRASTIGDGTPSHVTCQHVIVSTSSQSGSDFVTVTVTVEAVTARWRIWNT